MRRMLVYLCAGLFFWSLVGCEESREGINDVDHWQKQLAAAKDATEKERCQKILKDLAKYWTGKLKDSIARDDAVNQLAKLKDLSTLPALRIEWDKDEAARSTLATIFGDMGDNSVAPLLLENLKPASGSVAEVTKTNRLNRSIIGALVKLNYKEASGKVADLLHDKDPFVQIEAARAMARFKDPKALNGLVEILKQEVTGNPSWTEVRKQAVIAVGNICGETGIDCSKAVPDLVYALWADQGGKLYPAASYALFQVGEPALKMLAETLRRKNSQVESLFKKFKNFEEGTIEAKTAEVLGDFGHFENPDATGALLEVAKKIQALHKKNSATVAQGFAMTHAAFALARSGNADKAVPQIIDMIKDEGDPSIVKAYAEGLNILGDRRAVPALFKTAETDNEWIDTNIQAMTAATRLGGEEDIPRIGKLCDMARASALKHGKVKEEADFEKFRKSMEEKLDLKGKTTDPAKKSAIDKELADNEAAADTVIFYLECRKAQKRLEAAKECKQDEGCWLGKLSDKSVEVRDRAAWGLARSGTERAIPPLLKAITVAQADAGLSQEDRDKLRQSYFWALMLLTRKPAIAKAAVPQLEEQLKVEERNPESVRRLIIQARQIAKKG